MECLEVAGTLTLHSQILRIGTFSTSPLHHSPTQVIQYDSAAHCPSLFGAHPVLHEFLSPGSALISNGVHSCTCLASSGVRHLSLSSFMLFTERPCQELLFFTLPYLGLDLSVFFQQGLHLGGPVYPSQRLRTTGLGPVTPEKPPFPSGHSHRGCFVTVKSCSPQPCTQ